MVDFFTMLGAAFVSVTLLTAILWIIYYFRENASILDIGWGIGFILTAWSYFIFGVGNTWKMLAITLMVTIWGVRLTRHLYLRYTTAEHEDPRYELLRENWSSADHTILFLMLFVFQGMLIMLLSVPFMLVAYGSHSLWTHFEIWGIVAWAIGVGGEAIADEQLARFQRDPNNKGQVCRTGLWHFSRHPNYFFEILVWVGFFLFAYPSNGGLLAIISPIIVSALLLKISGIPLTEAQAIRTKGDAYREYQRTTSMLIPWFPKK